MIIIKRSYKWKREKRHIYVHQSEWRSFIKLELCRNGLKSNRLALQPTASTEVSLWRCTPSFLNFRINLTPRQLWLREEISRCALDSVLNEFHSRSGRFGRDKFEITAGNWTQTVLYCTSACSTDTNNWATQTSFVTKVSAVYAVTVYERICLQLHSSVTLASRSGRFTAGEKIPGTYWVGSWVGLPVWTYWRKEKFPSPAGIRIRVIQTLNKLSCSKFHIIVQNQPRPLAKCRHNAQNGTNLPRTSNYVTIHDRNRRLFRSLLG